MVVLPSFELDHVNDSVDQRQVGEGLREVPQLLAGVRVGLLAVELKCAGERQQLAQSFRARSYSPISHNAETSQKEQIVKRPPPR